MTTKVSNKTANLPRSAAVQPVARSNTISSSDQSATASLAGKRETVTEPPLVGGRVTKNARLLQLLKRPEGASIEDMMQTTDWQQHSVRGFLAGTVKKKLGLALTSSKVEGEVRLYRIMPRRGR